MILAFGWAEAGVVAALVGVGITAAALYVTIRGVRDQLWLHTFSEYTRRYAEVVRDLPSESRRPNSSFDVQALPEPEQERILNAARAYLNLTSEEFFLHSRGRIDDETWSIWCAGIEQTVRLPWLRGAWADLEPEYAYVPEFASFMTRCLAVGQAPGNQSAPPPPPAPRSRFRGPRRGRSDAGT